VRIPLAQDGTLLLNWPKGDYLESFRHLTYYELVDYESLMEDLAFNLELMEESGYLQYHDGQTNPLQAWYYAQGLISEVLETGDDTPLTELAPVREFFVSEAGAFLDGSAEGAILGDIAAALADPELSPEARVLFEDLREDIPSAFASTREIHRSILDRRTNLLESIPGSFIIIGYTGTGTTDIGVNPFVNEYANVGTHGAVVNTIITERFIDDLPVWISIVIAAVFAVLYVLVSRKRSATGSLALGFAGAGTVVVGSATTMVVARLFLPVMAPVLTVFLSAIGQSLFKYIELAKERNYIRHAFNHYLSADVINEIIDDPSRLRLGGEKRELTAMFTDVKGFSTISESLDPEDLVKLLNRYLSEMSDIIMQLRGTIDKYEGDAIISFFGAPVGFADHATRACRAAIRMKKIERYLNDHFLEEELSPHPLSTRVGINTGQMVVGNMGTANRMDYTIMGHAVNLAARLEGVNKQYGTWILTSELTYNDTQDVFIARKLDRVRVVGVNEPVRLYELIDETDQAAADDKEMVDEFHRGLTLFEGREWGEAGGIFSRLNREAPKDGPSRVFLERSEQFQKDPPPASWDGVFNLTRK
ncbi:MAG: adenylate/guanylate cyclase domain-containing protein, partial [Spirochaetales bacterium]|nr:adenylate/guanylate cyclase domain-containing protein [Spirochaetales bacterium]